MYITTLLQNKPVQLVLFLVVIAILISLGYLANYVKEKDIDLYAKRNIFFILSGIVIGIGLISLFIKGINLGLDFKGGTIIELGFYQKVDISKLRSEIENVDIVPKLEDVLIQPQENVVNIGLKNNQENKVNNSLYKTDKNITNSIYKTDENEKVENSNNKVNYNNLKSILLIKIRHIQQKEINLILDTLRQKYGKIELLKTESIGPTIGNELLRHALIAILIALVLQLIYIGIRFGYNIKYGIIADIALLHDVLVMVGIYSLMGKQADSPFLAALLTIIGYSVMDTIVIFDRIRENINIGFKGKFSKLVNTSVLQTMTRSINTLTSTLITLFALYFFGGQTLKNFAFALIVGIASGGYSSIFIASPLLVMWNEREQKAKMEEMKKRLVGSSEKDAEVKVESNKDNINSKPANIGKKKPKRKKRKKKF